MGEYRFCLIFTTFEASAFIGVYVGISRDMGCIPVF